MRSAKLAETAGFAATLLALSAPLGCASDHRVSPWGGPTTPRLDAFLPRSDLPARLASIDAETAPLGLARSVEIAAKLPGGAEVVIRGYDGRDAAGRAIHAVRAATARAVVMAVGPLDMGDADRRAATELVPALVIGTDGAAYRSGTDLNGDGAPDVVVKSDAGALEIWRLGELGAGRYEVAMEAPPLGGAIVGEGGRIALAGTAPIEPGDPIAPRLDDVAVFDGARYSNGAAAARAWHARRADEPRGAAEKGRDDLRLAGAIERAWHAILAGRPRKAELDALAREPVPEALRASFARHTRRLAAIGR